jgi:hypothetical protein
VWLIIKAVTVYVVYI